MDFSFYTKRFVLNLTFSFVMMWLCTEPTLVHGDIGKYIMLFRFVSSWFVREDSWITDHDWMYW